MAINKVVFGEDILIDLTSDTLTAADVLTGKTFHGKDGVQTTGTCAYDCDTSGGTAGAGEIISGQIAYVNGSEVTGTMVNNGSVTGYITDAETAYSIPSGFHDGGGTVSISDDDRTALGIGDDLELGGNIRQGVTILGVTGTMSTTEGMVSVAAEVDSFVGDTAQTYLPTAFDSTANAISQITVNPIPYTETANSYGTTVTIG